MGNKKEKLKVYRKTYKICEYIVALKVKKD